MLTIVGIGADGWAGLGEPARAALAAAEVFVGNTRQLALLPADLAGVRVTWPAPLLPAIPEILATHDGRRICVLASGDPMFHGIGATLSRMIGGVRVLSHPSSVSLACARLGWAVEEVAVVSLVGRPLAALVPAVQPGRRLVVLSADGTSPAAVAGLLTSRGYGESTLTVLANLAGPDEAVVSGTAATWEHSRPAALNVVAVECRADSKTPLLPTTPGLPDDAYSSDGQLTKREIRAITVARLAPVPGQRLWDVGAGSGSIGIEWMRAHPTCRAIAIESRTDRAARITANSHALGVPGLDVVLGAAPAALADLPGPDAVFVGGGATTPGLLDRCWEALGSGGRLVVNAVTVESELIIAEWHRRIGGDLVRIAVSRAAPVGGFTGWRPAMPVTQWAVTKE
jgi:precorrin-6B C5,15-methyltransferase / cobalt-precorrin-6B C5,C15-methyltransferase